MRPHGRAVVDPNNPSAFGVCQRCGFWYNLKDLVPQFIVAGPGVVNTNILVCTQTCLDELQWNLQTIVLPPDPMPVLRPSVENFAADEIDYLSTQDDVIIDTQDGEDIVTNQPSQNFSEPPA